MVVVVGIVTCSRGTVLYRSRSVEKGRVGTMLALISLTTYSAKEVRRQMSYDVPCWQAM